MNGGQRFLGDLKGKKRKTLENIWYPFLIPDFFPCYSNMLKHSVYKNAFKQIVEKKNWP